MPHDVFISHSARDKPYADAVCAKLESQSIRCWIAPRDIRPGMDWGSAILEAIDGARVMLLVFSSHANGSPQIKREVERAVNKELIVVPVRVEDVKPTGNLEYFLGTPHWLDAITPPFERHLDFIADSTKFWLERIQSDTTTPEPPRPPKPARDQQRAVASPNAIARTRSRPKWIAPTIAALVIALLGAATIFGVRYYAAQQELSREQAAQQAAAAQEQRDRQAEQQREKQAEQDRQRAAAEAEAHNRAEAMKAQKESERKAAQERERAAAEARKRAAAEQAQRDAELKAAQAQKEREAAEAAASARAAAEAESSAQKETNENDCYKYYSSAAYDQALTACRKAAEEGSAISASRMGLMYENGWGGAKNKPEAMKWYSKADELQDAP